MLNLALVALLSGSVLTGGPDGDCDKSKTECESTEAAVAEVAPATPSDVRSITADTYSYGRPSDAAPIKLWVEYGWGEVEGFYGPGGDDVEASLPAGVATAAGFGTEGDIVSQRLAVGAQINVINFPAFKLGAGAQLNVAQNKFQVAGTPGPFIQGDVESDFGLQNVKIYGTARGRVVGVHGGYILDLGETTEFGDPIPGLGFQVTAIGNSGGRDAIFFGGDFDYPSERFRLFGGIDYYLMQDADIDTNGDGTEETVDVSNDILAFNLGAGVRFSIFELGAALQIQTQLEEGFVDEANGSHNGTVAPYLKVSPPSLPVSLFVRGAVRDEFTEYGYALGGSNDIKPSLGFTAGLALGFD